MVKMECWLSSAGVKTYSALKSLRYMGLCSYRQVRVPTLKPRGGYNVVGDLCISTFLDGLVLKIDMYCILFTRKIYKKH